MFTIEDPTPKTSEAPKPVAVTNDREDEKGIHI